MVQKLTQSLEDYLEAILYIEKEKRVARVKDIAGALKVQMPSVTGAVRILKEKGLVDYEKNSYITLTPSGMKIAKSIYNKHQIVQRFLAEILMVKSDEAEEIACQIEHAMPGSIAARLESFTDFALSEKFPLQLFTNSIADD